MDEATAITHPIYVIGMRCECGRSFSVLANAPDKELVIKDRCCTYCVAIPVSYRLMPEASWEQTISVYIKGRQYNEGTLVATEDYETHETHD